MNYIQRALRFFVFSFLLLVVAGAVPVETTTAFAAEQSPFATDKTSGAERILLFDSRAELSANGTMTVTETIRFLVRGNAIKRGIVRDLPLVWNRKDGKRFRLAVTVLSVQRNGDSEPYSETKNNDLLAVRIGDPRKVVSSGIQEYRITYMISNHFSRFDDWDELYWNVTGNDWEFSMDSVRFSLRFAPELADAVTAATADRDTSPRTFPVPWESIDVYTGLIGEKGKKATVQQDGSIVSTGPLRKGEGLTVAYTWPRAILSKAPAPKADAPVLRLLLPDTADPSSFIYWLAPLLSAAYYLRIWKKLRPAGARKAVIPLFAPPDDVSPGLLRYVSFQHYDYTAFAADLLRIIAKGGMRIDRSAAKKKKRFFARGRFAREPLLVYRSAGIHLTREETHTLKTLFASKQKLDLAPSRQESVQNAFMYQEQEAEKAKSTFFYPAQWTWAKGFVFFLIFPVAMLVFIPLEDALPTIFFALFFSLLTLFSLAFVGPFRTVSSIWHIIPKVFGLVFLSPFWLAFGMLCYHVFPIFGTGFLPDGIVGAVIAALLVAAVARLTAHERTPKGEEMKAVAKGLKMYMEAAERRRFESLYPPVESVEHFERLLPYALALGVGKTWANRFEKYLEHSGEVAERFAEMHSWGSIRSFSAISAAAATPTPTHNSGSSGGGSSGSGSSGSGSSGGGSGGGGGSGW